MGCVNSMLNAGKKGVSKGLDAGKKGAKDNNSKDAGSKGPPSLEAYYTEKKTVIIEFGAKDEKTGAPTRIESYGSADDGAEKVVIVYDARHAANIMISDIAPKAMLAKYNEKAVFVLLLPTPSSAPQYLINAEMTVQTWQGLMHPKFLKEFGKNKELAGKHPQKLVRVDDYFIKGRDQVIKQLLENEEKGFVYCSTAKDGENILDFWRPDAVPGEPEEAEEGGDKKEQKEPDPMSRVMSSLYNKRAFIHL